MQNGFPSFIILKDNLFCHPEGVSTEGSFEILRFAQNDREAKFADG